MDWNTLSALVHEQLPFVLYAQCTVDYEGRANSHLADGNYLIFYKCDGSIQIHGADKILPRNYQGAGSRLSTSNNSLVSINRTEIIKIHINRILLLYHITTWSDKQIRITRTEKELVDKLYDHWNDYIGIDCDYLVKEYATDNGPVDIVGFNNDGHKHVVEVKRRKISIKDVTQLRRYLECMPNATGYIAAPEIGTKALKYAKEHHCKYICINYD